MAAIYNDFPDVRVKRFVPPEDMSQTLIEITTPRHAFSFILRQPEALQLLEKLRKVLLEGEDAQ